MNRLGGTLGSLSAIAFAGLLLGSMLATTDRTALKVRTHTSAITRSIVCAVLILLASTGLNRVGFRLKL